MQSSGVEVMPRPVDESKYRQPETVERESARRLKSSIKADGKRDEKVDNIRLRVPKGMREKIQDYVVSLPDYQIRSKEHPENDPKPNVNQWLVDLIRSQLPDQE